MKKLFPLILLSIVATLCGERAVFAVGSTRVSTAAGGNWNSASTWVGGAVPGKFDTAVIVPGAAVTVTADQTVTSLIFSNSSSSVATLVVNSGITLTVSAGITNQNSATMDTSALIQGAGTVTCVSLTVGGTTTPTPTSSDFLTTLTSTISNLAVSGNLTIKALYNSTQSAANQGTFALSSGSTSVGGTVAFVTVPFFGPTLTLATGVQDGTLTLSGATPFSFTGGGSSTFNPNGANATVIYSASAAQTVNATTYRNLALAGSGTKTLTGATVIGTLSMQGSAKANVAPVYGSDAVLEYAGSAAQTNGPELTTTIGNLAINNPNNVTLTNSPTVTNTLTLVAGRLITGANQLILGTNASIVGGSDSSYVNGKLQKNFSVGTQSFSFPLGDSAYAPLTLSNLVVTTAGAIRASTTAGDHPQIGSSGINASQSVNRYWTLTNFSGSFGSYDATFNYSDNEVDAGATPDGFSVSKWSGGVWSSANVIGIPDINTTSISGQSGFGDFVIGNETALELVWSGGGGANKNWSNGANWLSGLAPRANDAVFFFDNAAVAGVSNVNNVVDAAFTDSIKSLAFANTNNFHTMLISSGATLMCTSNFTVGTETYSSPTQTVVATITGPGTLNLNFSNTIWNVRQAVASGINLTNMPGSPRATLDLSGLANLNLFCRSMDVGVESASLRRAAGVLYLARTNVVRTTGIPTPGTTYGGNPGIYIGHNTQAFNQNPSGSTVYLGLTNVFFTDYVVVGRGNQTNNLLAFNPALIGNNPVAYFRSLDETNRVGVWTIGDNSASGTSVSSPSSGTNDFTDGRVDALVDTMFVGRGALNGQNNAAAPGIGTLTFDNGTIDVSTLYIGYQNLGTNLFSSGIGTVNVNSSNANLIVDTLEFAHATNTSVVSPSGALNVSGGNVFANTLLVGGGTATLALTNGFLAVSNAIGTLQSPLAAAAMTNSTLQLSVAGNSTNAFISSLTTGGVTNRINIAALPASISYPMQFTLIKYSGNIGGAGFNFSLGSLPPANPAYQGFLSNDVANSSIVLVLTPPPVKLAVTSINGGSAPLVGAAFSVTVQAQDAGGTPRNVTTNTEIALGLNTGSGVLSGTLNGIIPAGNNVVTLTNVFYNRAESGVKVSAAITTGENLTSEISTPFTVMPGRQTIAFPSPGNQTYGAAPITLTATASSGLPVSYSILSGPATVSNAVLTLTGAGSVTIQASQAGDANWNAATPTNQTISVATKVITGSITVSNKVYDGTTAAAIATRSLSGVINGDAVTLAGGTAVFSDKNVGNGKTVIATGLSLSGANAGNYFLTSTSATNTANITRATLTVTADDTNRTYGGLNPVFTASYNGFAPGDTTNVLSGAPSLTTTATTNSPAGSLYTIVTAQGTLSAANYSFNFVNGNLTVTPAPLTVIADDKSRPYGTTNPVFTASFSGFVNGENSSVLAGAPNFSTTATVNSPVGTYPISVTQGTLNSVNYTFSFTDGTLTVIEVAPVLSGGVSSAGGGSNQMVIASAGLKPNSIYSLMASTNLVDWREIATAQSSPGGTVSFTNIITAPSEYYRLYGP